MTFELLRLIVAPHGGGVDALDMTWVRVQTIRRSISLLELLKTGGKMTHAQRIAFQKMRDED